MVLKVPDVDSFLVAGGGHARAVTEGVLDFVHGLRFRAAAGHRRCFLVPEQRDPAQDGIPRFGKAARGYACEFVKEFAYI